MVGLQTADIPRAARDIVFGASFDNNIICADEKEIIVVGSSIADELKPRWREAQGRRDDARTGDQTGALLTKLGADGRGRSAATGPGAMRPIAAAIGLDVPGRYAPAVRRDRTEPSVCRGELMMPVIPLIRAANANANDRSRRAAGRRLQTHRRDAFARSDQPRPDGQPHQHQHLRQERSVHRRPGLWRREGWTSMTISTPTGEGVTNASSFVRLRRCVMVDHFRIV